MAQTPRGKRHCRRDTAPDPEAAAGPAGPAAAADVSPPPPPPFPSTLLAPFLKDLPDGLLEDLPAGCLEALVSAAAAAATASTAAEAGLPACLLIVYQCTRVPLCAAYSSLAGPFVS
jgi:hypothetical protein